MRARRVFHAVDSHTEGMPTRVIVGGGGVLPGAIPVPGQRGLAQQRGVIHSRSLFENRDERAARGRHMNRLDQMHLAVRFNDGFDRFHLDSNYNPARCFGKE